jgi:hypothetical protein
MGQVSHWYQNAGVSHSDHSLAQHVLAISRSILTGTSAGQILGQRHKKLNALFNTFRAARKTMRRTSTEQRCCPTLPFPPIVSPPRDLDVSQRNRTNCAVVILGTWLLSLDSMAGWLHDQKARDLYTGSIQALHVILKASCDDIKTLKGHETCSPAAQLRGMFASCINMSMRPWSYKDQDPARITPDEALEELQERALKTGLATEDQATYAAPVPLQKSPPIGDATRMSPMSRDC